jgi:hypothetical protein
MGFMPARKRVPGGAFSDKKHPLLLLAFMLVKADKARIAESVLHTMGTVTDCRRRQGFHCFI